MRATNAPSPADAIRAKQMTAPATAPDRLTPFTKRAKVVNTTATIAAIQGELLPIMPAKVITAVSRHGSPSQITGLQDVVCSWSAYQEFGFDSGLPSLVHASKCRNLV